MTLHVVLAVSATLISLAFALSTLERWLDRRRRHEAAWTISLFMFSLASLALWTGAAIGWAEWSFRTFYLFGAILNVPFLALGTIYLLTGERTGDRWAFGICLFSAFAAGMVVTAPLVGAINPDALPQGTVVFGPGPRIAAAVGSGVAAMIVFGGAIWSAWQLLRSRRNRQPEATTQPSLSPTRLAAANIFIAVGTLILSAAGVLNSALNEMDAFAITLVVGIAVIFAGFLMTFTPKPPAAPTPPTPWYPPAAVSDADAVLLERAAEDLARDVAR